MAIPVSELEARRSQVLMDIALIESQLLLLRQNSINAQNQREIDALQAELGALINEARSLSVALAGAKSMGPQTQSAGQIVQNAAAAEDAGASTQNPAPPVQVIAGDGRIVNSVRAEPTNAVSNQVAIGEDGEYVTLNPGINDPSLTTTTTQSIPPPSAQPVIPQLTAPGGGPLTNASTVTNPAITAAQTSGVGAAGDDQTNTVRFNINTVFNGPTSKIVAQDNLLNNFASYTYSISIYIMSKEDLRRLVTTKRKFIPSYQLLMQSAGAPVGAGASAPNSDAGNNEMESQNEIFIQGRNQFFPLDYYIDDVRLTSLINGRGTRSAHNVFEMKFKITEPNGLTFFDNLVAATKKFAGAGANQNYAAQNFLMVIRFYGYDINGKLVAGSSVLQDSSGVSDRDAIVEKFIPFQFTNIKFKLDNNLVTYDCEAVCPQNLIASGSQRGVIPNSIELTGTTVKDILLGNQTAATNTQSGNVNNRQEIDPADLGALNEATSSAQTNTTTTVVGGSGPTQNQAPATANAAPAPTFANGLVDFLNRQAQEQKTKGIFEQADEYDIVIVDQAIQSATVVPPGQLDKTDTPLLNPQTAGQGLNGARQNMLPTARSVRAIAGRSIISFIDQLVRNSSYIYNQQTKIIEIDQNGKEVDIANGTPAQSTAWYRIGLQAEPKEYDYKRNDYAYKITYQINMYKVNDLKSDYFPQSRYQGVHKQYKYWFTGENTDVLDYEQDYNYLYYIVVNSRQPAPNRTSNWRDYQKRAFQTRSDQSDQGAKRKINEPSASAASYLYSPSDTATARLKILGDPAWIQQGELWSGVQGSRFLYGAFLPDGTINYESQEVLFEVVFNTPVDYNLTTGLMDPGQNNYGANRNQGEAGQASQTYVYRAIQCVSTFSGGSFTQDIEGAQIFFPVPINRAQAVPNASTTTAAAVPGFDPSSGAGEFGQDPPLSSTNSRIGSVDNEYQVADSAWRVTDTSAYTGTNIVNAAEVSQSTDPVISPRTLTNLQNMFPTEAGAPTSGSQIIGTAAAPGRTDYTSGGVYQTTITVTIPTNDGSSAEVSNTIEVNSLYNQGLISLTARNAAVVQLNALTAQQQALVTSDAYPMQPRET